MVAALTEARQRIDFALAEIPKENLAAFTGK
jgi:hypothetical protein